MIRDSNKNFFYYYFLALRARYLDDTVQLSSAAHYTCRLVNKVFLVFADQVLVVRILERRLKLFKAFQLKDGTAVPVFKFRVAAGDFGADDGAVGVEGGVEVDL